MQELPIPNVENWQRLYQPNAQAICIKDNPPMRGFGKPLKVGDVVDVKNVCWDGKYQISVAAQCALYDIEGYFEVVMGDPAE